MTTPSPFEVAQQIGNQFGQARADERDQSAIGQILNNAMKSGNPQDLRDAKMQILSRVSPERQQVALSILDNAEAQIKGVAQKKQLEEFYKSKGFDPRLASAEPSVQKEFIKSNVDENLWRDIEAKRAGNQPQGTQTQPTQAADVQNQPSQEAGQQPQPIEPTEQPPESPFKEVKPIYASNAVEPKLFRKDIAKYETTRLAEANKGFQRNQNYMKTVEDQALNQKAIQDSVRQAITDVQSGNVSGALATVRNRLGKAFPAILSAEERNFDNVTKNIALEQFASTPGFRAQAEFAILRDVLPKIGDKKLSQEMNLKAIFDASIMRSKEEEIILDIINSSPNGEVPLNLKDMVNQRLNEEWRKLYARRYAENPQVWDEYIKKNPSDPMFKDIKNVAVPSSSIDWNNYTRMTDDKGKPVAVPNAQVKQKESIGFKLRK